MPRFDLYKDGGILTQRFYINVSITDRFAAYDGATLHPRGELELSPGYFWDFGSGAIDTPAVVLASLVHDALINLINAGKLPASLRKKVDKEYLRLLKLGGVPWYRRYMQYYAIRGYVRFFKLWA
jgi:hypothetical protein